ncbi:MAG TPA: type IV pilus assembly protein PilM [Verrucomicrobiae bacterium]|nr:type IV pilus assembly protein PilM [Verrucomicrobiae bacterium]
MLNAKSFLTVDFGAGSLKLAEFEVNEAGGLRLKQYALKSLGAEGSQETTREGVMQKALQELLAERGIRSKDVNVCAPGFHVFSKFVKLPPVDTSKVTQIIQYEAQQNVPFPLAEVVWDYQILGSAPTGELEVLLVAIKTDIVEGLFRVAESSGLRLQLADVSPAALCNAFRYNYGDLEDCTMLLDIGAKTSNLLFFEKGKVYSRSINLGANSITQDFSNESKLSWSDAEQKKINEGFVSLGGAYEEPENAHQAAISKIARQFMTRLHIQVNQTMQFYRGQQGGSAPQRLFLCGGASLMPYTAQFFAEKLNVPVEYFNPFRSVQIDPSINLEELARVAHSLGEVVGLGLRNLAHCPVELNLMPESTLNWVQFNQKKPYLMASAFSLVLIVFAAGFIYQKLSATYQDELDKLGHQIDPLQARAQLFKKDLAARDATRGDAELVAGWIQNRFYWADVLSELHRILVQVEARKSADLNYPVGLWIERCITDPDASAAGNSQSPYQGNVPPQYPGPGGDAPDRRPAPATAAAASGSSIFLFCRGVDLTATNSSANRDIANEFINELHDSKFFENPQVPDRFDQDPNGTFTFGVTLKLKRPLKL